MPRVQKYGELKVATAPLPGARRQAHETYESQGGPVGDAMAQFGGTLARIGMQGYAEIQQAERERADDVTNLETARRFNELEHGLLYDEQSGILNMKGLAPHEQRQAYMNRFDEEVSKWSADLKSDKQRLYFEQQRIQRRSSIGDRIDVHSVQQLDAYEGEQFKATIASSVNAAAAAGVADLPRVRQELAFQEEAIARHGARVGMSPEAQRQFRDELRAKVHSQIVDTLLAQQKDKVASAYFAETRDAIAQGDPQAIERITKALEEGTRLGEAQRQSDRILATTQDPAAAREAAKKIEDPKIRQTTLELVEHELTVRDRKKREDHQAMTLRGLNIAEQTGRWSAIPPNEWSQYEVGERAAIRNYLEDKAKGVTVKTDPEWWAKIAKGLNDPDPETRRFWQNANPVQFVDVLSPSDFQEFIRAQQSSKKGDEAVLVNQAAQARMVDEALGAMGLNPNPAEPGKADHDEIAYARTSAFRRAVRSAVSRLEQEKGKQATDPEVQAIVDQLRTQTNTTRRGLRSVPVYAFEEAQAQADSIRDIPASEVRRLKQILREEGGDWSDAGVLKFFNSVVLPRTRKDR